VLVRPVSLKQLKVAAILVVDTYYKQVSDTSH